MADAAQGTFDRYVRLRLVAALFVLAWPWLAPEQGDVLPPEHTLVPVEWYVGWAALVTASVLLQRLLRARVASSPTLVALGLLFDTVGIACLTAYEGGLYSLFSLLYFGVIGGAAALLGRRAALVAAATSTLGLLVASWVEQESMAGALPRIVSDISLRVFAFFLMAEMVFRTTRYRELELQHEKVLGALRAGVLILEPGGELRSLNPAARQMLGEVEGKPAADLFKGLGGGPAWEETHHDRRLVCVRSPLPDGGSVLVIEDLTELYTARERAARDERLAAVGELAAAFAHEIRNPLAALSGALQLVAEDSPSPMVKLALGEAGRMERLVADFMSSTRLSVVRPVPVNLDELVAAVIAAAGLDRRYQGLDIQLDATPVSACVDPDRIRQVLENLLLNAAQAMPGGGAVRVRLRGGAPADGVRMEVEDDGPGLPAPELRRIFDPFYTRRSGGTGLGLAIVDHAIRGHSGTIQVRQREGGGLLFSIWLPVNPPGSAPQPVLPRGPEPANGAYVDGDHA